VSNTRADPRPASTIGGQNERSPFLRPVNRFFINSAVINAQARTFMGKGNILWSRIIGLPGLRSARRRARGLRLRLKDIFAAREISKMGLVVGKFIILSVLVPYRYLVHTQVAD
jgi:hypothetical protein